MQRNFSLCRIFNLDRTLNLIEGFKPLRCVGVLVRREFHPVKKMKKKKRGFTRLLGGFERKRAVF